jgi:hypothetical protein
MRWLPRDPTLDTADRPHRRCGAVSSGCSAINAKAIVGTRGKIARRPASSPKKVGAVVVKWAARSASRPCRVILDANHPARTLARVGEMMSNDRALAGIPEARPSVRLRHLQ